MKKIEMVVEIPKGSANKYEFDEYTRQWKLDRVLAGAMVYPEEYGYVPNTLDYDGDPLDVICLTSYPTFPSCRIVVRIVGLLKMLDQGLLDYKLVAVNATDPRFSHIEQLGAIGTGKLSEISNFFLRYKELEKKDVVVEGYAGKEEALAILKECSELFINRELFSPGTVSRQQTLDFLRKKMESKK